MLDTEKLMDEVVVLAGGTRVDQLLDQKAPQRAENADYLFKQDNAIGELKSLQQELNTSSYRSKLNDLFRSWHNRGLLRVYGHTVLQMRDLPHVCQREWMRLLTLSLQNNVISKANKQIQKTKEELKITSAHGVLLLANDGNLSFDPYNLVILVSHILKKVHPDGGRQYSSIDAVVFFSANLPIFSPGVPNASVWWFNGLRPSTPKEVVQVLQRLETSWYKRLSSHFGYEIPRVHLRENAMEDLRFAERVRPPMVILKP